MSHNGHERQLRAGGKFIRNPKNPGRERVSLRVNAEILEDFKELRGKGFSGELSRIVEEYMLSKMAAQRES